MQKKKGISLIVLVITIIVMAILAGAIILTLNNSGIINKAQDAVNATNEATVKEVASLGWAEAYTNGARTEEELKTGVEATLEKNKINTEDYIISVTTSGVTVKNKSNVWVKQGFAVVKGDQVLEIGDVVNYDAGVSGYTAGWKVLGADDEGNLLIMSAGDVKTITLGDNSDLATSIEYMETGVAQLNAECEPYGYGEGVVGVARSITAEDVNSVTEYNPKTASNGNPYGYGELYQYGNTVTYSYNGTTTPAYSSAVKSGTLSMAHSKGFYYYNGDKVVHINDLTTGTSGETFATLTSNYYTYGATSLTTISKENNTKAYSMIFGNDDAWYLLASPYAYLDTSTVNFGMYLVFGGNLASYYILYPYSTPDDYAAGVRAVVTLSSEITFTGNSTDGWSY